MPHFAMPLPEPVLDAISELTGHDVKEFFGDNPYVIGTLLGPTEFNLKFVDEDEALEAAKNDAELQIISI